MLICWRLVLTVIKSAIPVIVSLKVTLAMCGSLASTMSDSENDDDAFVGPTASWFVLIDCKIKLIRNTNNFMVYTRHRQYINAI